MVYDKRGVAEKGTVLPGNNSGGVLGLGHKSPECDSGLTGIWRHGSLVLQDRTRR